MRTIRLSELVQHGRLALVPDLGSEPPARLPHATAEPLVVAPVAANAIPRSRFTMEVADKIEVLAIELMSISQAGKADPEAIMRDALMSIDRCLGSIVPLH